MTNVQLARALGWTSLAIGATEIAATQWLQEQLGVNGHETLLRAFGVREIAAGVTILAKPGINGVTAAGLWSRVAGDLLDLTMLGLAAAETRNPKGLGAITAMVAGATALDIVATTRVQRELLRAQNPGEVASMPSQMRPELAECDMIAPVTSLLRQSAITGGLKQLYAPGT